MSGWGDMPTRGLLARTTKIQVSVLVNYKVAIIIIIIIISLNANCSRQNLSEDVRDKVSQ
jgi:hypothetical protein